MTHNYAGPGFGAKKRYPWLKLTAPISGRNGCRIAFASSLAGGGPASGGSAMARRYNRIATDAKSPKTSRILLENRCILFKGILKIIAKNLQIIK